jgi:hypothetical protein
VARWSPRPVPRRHRQEIVFQTGPAIPSLASPCQGVPRLAELASRKAPLRKREVRLADTDRSFCRTHNLCSLALFAIGQPRPRTDPPPPNPPACSLTVCLCVPLYASITRVACGCSSATTGQTYERDFLSRPSSLSTSLPFLALPYARSTFLSL